MLILGVLLLVLVAVTLLVTFVAVTWEHDMVQRYGLFSFITSSRFSTDGVGTAFSSSPEALRRF
ncbi:hypothetical protein PC121_g21768 [Phytophthora cactorum]|nr:hypothetical protein PC121_g21768 [Phytophthora cactorum]